MDSAIQWINIYPVDSAIGFPNTIVIYPMDSAIQWINIYAVDSAIGFPNTYPLDSDLSDGWRYPTLEQPGPD